MKKRKHKIIRYSLFDLAVTSLTKKGKILSPFTDRNLNINAGNTILEMHRILVQAHKKGYRFQK